MANKRCWQVHVPGYAPFPMILMESDADPQQIAKAIFGPKAYAV